MNLNMKWHIKLQEINIKKFLINKKQKLVKRKKELNF